MDYSDHSIGLSTATVDGLPQALPNVESTLPDTPTLGRASDHQSDHENSHGVIEVLPVPGEQQHDAGVTKPSFLRLVPSLEVSAPSVVSVPPTSIEVNSQMTLGDLSRVRTSDDLSRVRTSGKGDVSNLFGDVSDAEFPEVSANHPARSMQAQPTAATSTNSALARDSAPKSPRTLRTLAALSSHPFTPQTDELGLPIVVMKQPEALPRQQAPGRSRSYERRRPGSVGGVRAAVARSTHPALASDAAGPTSSPGRTVLLTNRQAGSGALASDAAGPTSSPGRTVLLTNRQAGSGAPASDAAGPTSSPGRTVLLTNGLGVEERTRSSVDGVLISTQTLRTAGTTQRQTVVDLREAEADQPVRRRSANTQTAQRAIANNSYFAGHDYELDRRQPYGRDRGVTGRAAGSVERVERSERLERLERLEHGTSELRRERLSLQVKILDRTGLSPAVLSGLSIATVGVISVGLLFSPLFALHRIDVRRAGSVNARVRAAADLRTGEPLISLDVAAIQRRIVALPEVSAAKVERTWPRGLRITVSTRTPVVALAHGGRIALVATDGTVLRDFSSADGTNSANGMVNDGVFYTPIAVGVIAPVGKTVMGDAKRIVDLASALDPDLRDRLVSAAITGGDLNASFSSAGRSSNLSVHFGDDQELDIKAQALGALLGAESSGNVTGIDLTVPDAPVLRLSDARTGN